MVKASRKTNDDIVDKKTVYTSIFLLLLMVLSVLGIAVSSGSFSSSNKQQDIPLQQFNSDGQVFWGSVKSGYTFIYTDIAGFEGNLAMKNLASSIKSQKTVYIYKEGNFSITSDTRYLLDRILASFKITGIYSDELDCNRFTIIFSQEDATYDNNCHKILANDSTAMYKEIEVLSYHMLK